MAEFNLRVTPETLEQKAGEFTGLIQEIKGRFDRIQSVASKTKSYWRGEAGDQDREGYASFQEDIDFVLRRLEEHPDDLLQMAGIYRKAERDVAGTNATLKIDLIV